jgi:hypothetical protein
VHGPRESSIASRGLDSAMTALRMRTGVHRYAMRVLEALGHAPLMDPALHVGVRTLAIGLDPLRVLVLGGGLAVGYGVRSRDEAFDGPLVRAIAEATRRGVVLENRAVQHVGLQQTVASIGAAGTHTFHVAVWCPSFAEGMRRLRLSGWRSELHAMIRELRVEVRTPLVLTCMPVPAGLHPAALIARPWVHRLNRVIRQVASEWDDAVAVDTEPFVPAEIGEPITDAAYFAAVAARIAPSVIARVGAGAAVR